MLLLVAILASCTLALAATKVTTTGKVVLREKPRLSGKYIRSVKKGTTLKVKAEKADKRGVVWYKVKYKGKVGWISSKITNRYKKVTVEQPVQQPVEQPVQQPVEQPVQQPVQQPEDKPVVDVPGN